MPKPQGGPVRIGELARRSGVSVRALRYYEEQRLLVPERTPAGQRTYTEDAAERVRTIQQLYAAGLSSSRIAELIPCMDTDTTTDHQIAMLRAEHARISTQIEKLTTTLTRLDGLIDAAIERRA
ncbi:MerR family transcriptional regulator [Saccharomonospora sp. CUA-673]|nr:MerR family transcriptional regulator [Saccharomonospora sp. CUA-673]